MELNAAELWSVDKVENRHWIYDVGRQMIARDCTALCRKATMTQAYYVRARIWRPHGFPDIEQSTYKNV